MTASKKRSAESVEDYLETILLLNKKNGKVRSIDIASEMDFSKPSVSVAMKNLREKNYIQVDSEGYITLTEDGRSRAEKVYERHTILTECLVAIGVDRETAMEDACRIEHDLSDITFEALKKHMSK